ncbi:hypothetical protein [Mycobacteroides chelonae]|jgi:hypothetical protein|uniref:Uncharacterized protein n=1 Tax=Mycobacteroides chelonae TaxID=1774 RepID=A0AB73U0B9_MYCCH|nr:hypothetical protein [Mycobacteroides chelonae]MBF9327719.1 hypothetical protein [Mycobacteroides chelonae]MBF9421897.1 hypothetical protein [Mycobacteroides chelonae]MBF9435914.1 hypothetical protein [Mycobacteroides chelonae]MBV6361810.1 hypothetical protein [Mycobacteroides chelonae]MEC4837559.1 hypothetical protein [Mycobacteroides chelonae]
MKHGVAGFQSGCRCVKCFTDETQRAQEIAEAQLRYWEPINDAADESWTSRWRLRTSQRSNVRSWASEDIALARDRSIPARKVAARLGRTLSAVNAMRYRPAQLQDDDPISPVANPSEEGHESRDKHRLIMEIPGPASTTCAMSMTLPTHEGSIQQMTTAPYDDQQLP